MPTLAPVRSTREQRMLLTLLASCDPCLTIEAGSTPAAYEALAVLLTHRLQEPGCHAADLFVLFPPDANAARALQLVSTAMDWWSRNAACSRATELTLSIT